MVGEPKAGKKVLRDNHTNTYHHSVGDTQLVIAGQTVTAEDGAADDGLQQIVGETHATEDAQMMEYTAYTLEGIPCRDNCRDNHQEDDEVVDGVKPHVKLAKIYETQGDDNHSRYHKNLMPNLQIPALIIE